MKTYNELQVNNFYLVQENEGEEIVLIEPILETEHCVLVVLHTDEESTFWRKKNDEIFELVEELSEESQAEYDTLFEIDDIIEEEE